MLGIPNAPITQLIELASQGQALPHGFAIADALRDGDEVERGEGQSHLRYVGPVRPRR